MEVDPGCGAGGCGARTTIEGKIQRQKPRSILAIAQGKKIAKCRNGGRAADAAME